MDDLFHSRQRQLREAMSEANLDIAIITDDDSVYYMSGYFDYLHMEFGRPTLLIIEREGNTTLITPEIDLVAAQSQARVDKISSWNDGLGEEWRQDLPDLLKAKTSGPRARIAIEPDHIAPLVKRYLDTLVAGMEYENITPLLSRLRMIKSSQELQIARHAGEVAMAMMTAARETIGAGVAEFEVGLATTAAGTRKAAEILKHHYDEKDMSPNMHFLQIMASGEEIIKTHHRASTRIMQMGEPVFICFCGMTNFHKFKLGFDRTFWIGAPKDEHAKVYETAVASQAAALSALRPGVSAESVHAAYAEVIQEAGYDYPFRCGRATGLSFLEAPQLITGDTTILQPGMVMAVDGSVLISDFRAQVGDSFIITEDGYEQITHHPKQLDDMIL